METIALNLIRRDGGTQSRAALSEEKIAEYADGMRDGIAFPPVVVFYDGEVYWLADGFHRAEALDQLGRSEAICDVRQGTVDEAVWFGAGCNLYDSNGKPRGLPPSAADRKRAARICVERFPGKSSREIAKHVGVSHPTVLKYRGELVKTTTSERQTVTGTDGKQYPARRQPNPDLVTEARPSTEHLNEPGSYEPTPVDHVASNEREPPSERRPITVPPPEPEDAPEPEEDAPSPPLQSVADAWNEMTEEEQDDFLDAVGAVRCSTLEALAEQRYANDEYHDYRRRERDIAEKFGQTLPQKMISFVLDGGELALARLGLNWSSTEAEAKRAFRQASLQAHPDRGGTDAEFTAISRANAIVMRWLQGKAA